MEVDYQAVEHELCRIPEVSAARIVARNGNEPEVHIVACGDRQAQHVARDVQSVARASFGLELDGLAISVVQMEDPGPDPAPANGRAAPQPESEPPPRSRPAPRAPGHAAPTGAAGGGRVTVERVVPSRAGASGSVEVDLRAGAAAAHGHTAGTSGAASLKRSAAAATLDALRQLLPATDRAEVASATIVNAGDHAIAVVTIALVIPPHDHEETLAGAAIVREAGPLDAVARAVLDAMNRRMAILPAR